MSLQFACKLLIVVASLLGRGAVAAETIPLPRERPVEISPERSSLPATAEEPSACQTRLAELAAFKPLPPITGPGECAATDVVTLQAVLLPDKRRVALAPPPTLRCPMAEAVANWVRDDLASAVATLGAPLRSVENYDSFDCRGRNGIPGAKLSEHGRANALDVRAFKLANGKSIEPNNVNLDKPWRESLRRSVCGRFSTVLGNGSDGFHENHIHLDLIERRGGYKMCQWDVLDAAEAAALAAKKAAEAAARVAAAAAKTAAATAAAKADDPTADKAKPTAAAPPPEPAPAATVAPVPAVPSGAKAATAAVAAGIAGAARIAALHVSVNGSVNGSVIPLPRPRPHIEAAKAEAAPAPRRKARPRRYYRFFYF